MGDAICGQGGGAAREIDENVDCSKRANEMMHPSIAAEIIPCPISSAPSKRSLRMEKPSPTPKRMPPMIIDMAAAVIAKSKFAEPDCNSESNAMSLIDCHAARRAAAPYDANACRNA